MQQIVEEECGGIDFQRKNVFLFSVQLRCRTCPVQQSQKEYIILYMNIYIWLVSKRDVFLLSTLLQNYMPVSRLPGSFCIFCTMCIPLLFVVHKSSVWDWCFWTTVFPATSMCGWLEGVHCLLFGDMWHVDKIEWKEFSLCMYKDRSMKKNGWHLCCFPCVAGSNSDHCQWHHDWLSDASRFLRLGRIHGKKWLQGPAFPAVLYQSKPWGCWKLKTPLLMEDFRRTS